MIVEHDGLMAFCTVVVLGTCLGWLSVQLVRLRRNLRAEGDHRDAIFGNIVGIVMMLIGLAGVAKHYWF